MMCGEDALGTATAERPGCSMLRVEERTTGRAFEWSKAERASLGRGTSWRVRALLETVEIYEMDDLLIHFLAVHTFTYQHGRLVAGKLSSCQRY